MGSTFGRGPAKIGEPTKRTILRYLKDLGLDAKKEYVQLRETYKAQGLSPQDAHYRAMKELKVEARWQDWKRRKSMGEAMHVSGVLTPGEAQEVVAGYSPLRMDRVEEIGQKEMSLAEQVKWAMRQAARVQSGEEPPTRFPCEGALFWYQSAVQNRREFEKLVMRVDAPGGDPDNLYLQDSQYQYAEIEKQLREALEEVGAKIIQYAEEYKERHGTAAQARE